MKKSIDIGIKALLTAMFAVAVYTFYSAVYRYHVTYHEQYQLFQYTAEYARQVIGRPGGLAEYLSRYLVQYFIVASWGAAIIAVMLAVLQLATAWAMRARSLARYALSFIPALVMWMSLCDENGMPTAAIALCVALVAAAATGHVRPYWLRVAIIAVLTPVMYLIAGPIGLSYTLIAANFSLFTQHSTLTTQHSTLTTHHSLLVTLSLILLALATPWLAQYLCAYPLDRLFYGLNYYRYPFVVPVVAWVATAAAVALACLSPWVKQRTSWVYGAVAVCVVALIGVFGIRGSVNMDKEEVFGYDNMVRHRQWNDIVARAMDRHPDKPLGVAALNLALAKSGVLGDHMFRFYQNGTQGLIPPFERDLTMPLMSAEIFYNLGMVNSAQRFTYEAQEAIPDYQKSARCYKRLAETYIVNGDYEAARKYLKTLQHTLMYDDWATKTLAILGDEQAIDNHPEFGQLRQLRYKTDHFFSEDEMDSMLGLLFLDNRSNKTAFEYLLAWSLLNRDLPRFYDCYVLGKDLGYDHIPNSYQEALALKWTMEHDSWQGLPWSLSPQVMQRMQQYIIDRQQGAPLAQKYAGTYWTYYFQDK